jgi:hypothetical protein
MNGWQISMWSMEWAEKDFPINKKTLDMIKEILGDDIKKMPDSKW